MRLLDEPTTTTQPTSLFVQLAGAVRQLTWAGLRATLDGIYAAATHVHDASAITSGVLDPARIPVLYSGVHVASSGDLTALSSGQQATISNGAIVTTSDGRRWVYSGSGSKTNAASYIEMGDTSPDWSVLANKPATFTPSAHAGSHGTGGSDPISLDSLAPPNDSTYLDATTALHGLMPKAAVSKLAGISAGADATGAAVHAATAKGTPVDADEMPLLDSAASFGLAKITLTILKAFLKAYNDTLYPALAHAARHKSGGADVIKLDEFGAPTDNTNLDATTAAHGLMPKAAVSKLAGIANNANNYTLPAPGVSTLGGVMRNTGGSRQIVNGINSDGSLSFVDPAAGVQFIRAQATIEGYTSTDTPATAPAGVTLEFSGGPWLGQLTVNYTEAGNVIVNQVYTLGFGDPEDGSIFINVAGYDAPSFAAFFVSYLDSLFSGTSVSVTNFGTDIYLTAIATGANTSLTASTNVSALYLSGGGSGTDDIPPGGLIPYTEVIGYQSGKVMMLQAVRVVNNGLDQNVMLVDDDDGDAPVPAMPDTGSSAINRIEPDSTTIDKWQRAITGALYFYFNTTVTSGAATVYVDALIYDVPAYGTFLYVTCIGVDLVGVYANGAGGTYTVTIESNFITP